MGGGCYTNENRDLVIVGNWCPNKCFSNHGTCGASEIGAEKNVLMCELRPNLDGKLIDNAVFEILKAIDNAIKTGRSVFLYTPDMFNKFYLNAIVKKLPNSPDAYIAVNACVKSFMESGMSFEELHTKGIKEVWFGVESGSESLRDKYNKPSFANKDILKITELGRDAEVNVCWFLVDGDEDTPQTRLETYDLLKEAQPFRFHFSPLSRAA